MITEHFKSMFIKGIITFCIAVFLASEKASAQTEPVYDNIPVRSVIKIEQISSGEFIQYGNSPAQVVNKFDVPTDITTVYWEMDEVTATKYHYDGIILDFVEDKLVGLKFTSDKFQLKIDQHTIRIGNHKNTLQVFPISYSNFKNGGTAITMDSGDHDFFLIDTENNLITFIDHRTF